MFDGVPEQFHQFIASRTSVPLPLSFPLHGSTAQSFPSFDPFPASHQTLQLQSHLLPQLHHHPSPAHKEEEKEMNSLISTTNLELERERSIDPWLNEEVLALLRIRSSMESLFLDFTWEHISRKLAELGFKRSAEKCKEKFEEESRHFNSMSYSKNFRFFSDLEELCHGDNPPPVLAGKNQNVEEKLPNNEEVDKVGQTSLDEDSRNETVGKSNSSQENEKKPKDKKRKRQRKLEMLMGFCEEIVNKMMAQQEELNNRLIEDMVKRDEEKIAREEAWKKQEIERINKEIEIRAQEQAIAGDRQTKLIEFLKKLTSNSSEEDVFEVSNGSFSLPSRSSIRAQNPNPISQPSNQNPSSMATQNNSNVPTSSTESLAPHENPNRRKGPTSTILDLATQNPANNTQDSPLPSTPKTPQNQNLAQNEREDIGKRWSREAVLALINLRCSLNSSGGEDKEGAKGPLWERISQGMLELGHKRSSKRCKEKWENINKYFRKTKDVNKKRSLDSRTCPYFHQLSSLYCLGTLVAPLDGPENHSPAPQNCSDTPETLLEDGSSDANMHVGEGGQNLIQMPSLDFEF